MAERRSPKTCLPESRTWLQLARCGLQPSPLAFSCMTVTLHTDEALMLFHSHANSEKARHADGLGVGCTTKVNEQLQFAQQVVSKFLQKFSHCPKVWNIALLTDLCANKLRKASSSVRWAVVLKELPINASLRYRECFLVRVGSCTQHNASLSGVMQKFGGPVRWCGCATESVESYDTQSRTIAAYGDSQAEGERVPPHGPQNNEDVQAKRGTVRQKVQSKRRG